MAHEPKQTVRVPELDGAQGEFQLEFSTRKYSNGQIVSAVHGQRARDGMITFMLYSDFSKTYARTNARATQHILDSQHAATFSPAAVSEITAEAIAFYAAKSAEKARAA